MKCTKKEFEAKKLVVLEDLKITRSIKKTSENLNLTYIVVHNIAKKYPELFDRGWTKNPPREDIFDMQTSESAYITGVLHSDSHIRKNGVITIKSTDLDWLEEIREIIFPNTTRGVKIYNDNNQNHKSAGLLFMHNNKLLEDANINGCFNNKTYDLDFPTTIPDELMGDYLRGFFDGDGCIYVYDKYKCKSALVSISTTKQWSEGLIKWLRNKNIKAVIYEDKRHDNRIGALTISNIPDIIRFYNLIYNNIEDKLFLYRKYEKYTNYIKFKKEKYPKKYGTII